MKISAVSEQSGLSVDTLRYDEKIGLLPPVNRTHSGIRDYDELDVKRIGFVTCMRTVSLARARHGTRNRRVRRQRRPGDFSVHRYPLTAAATSLSCGAPLGD